MCFDPDFFPDSDRTFFLESGSDKNADSKSGTGSAKKPGSIRIRNTERYRSVVVFSILFPS